MMLHPRRAVIMVLNEIGFSPRDCARALAGSQAERNEMSQRYGLHGSITAARKGRSTRLSEGTIEREEPPRLPNHSVTTQRHIASFGSFGLTTWLML